MKSIALRQDFLISVIRKAAKEEKCSRICRRLLGIAHLLEGGSREECQKIACLSASNFRTWIKRFNEFGIEGLKSKKPRGRPLKLSPEILEKLKSKVLSGPGADEGLVRYRIVDLQRFLREEHEVSMGISGIWYNLQELNLTWKTGRQRHSNSRTQIQETFKKSSRKI